MLRIKPLFNEELSKRLTLSDRLNRLGYKLVDANVRNSVGLKREQTNAASLTLFYKRSQLH
jgi:hypothetical protein